MKKNRCILEIAPLEKRIRSTVIKQFMIENGIANAVCFSCGNASAMLKEAGINLLDISPNGDLEARRWFKVDEIGRMMPGLFDATSGHLPNFLMVRISELIKSEMPLLDNETEYVVPTGSGESAICLKMAVPEAKIIPCYDDRNAATRYSEYAPLNPLVKAMFDEIIHLK